MIHRAIAVFRPFKPLTSPVESRTLEIGLTKRGDRQLMPQIEIRYGQTCGLCISFRGRIGKDSGLLVNQINVAKTLRSDIRHDVAQIL